MKSCTLSHVLFWYHTSPLMYPRLLALFSLFSVDLPYIVVIHPSSCSVPTLFLLLGSFFLFLILFPISSIYIKVLVLLSASGLLIFTLKVSTRFSSFLHIWNSDVRFSTVSSRVQIKTVHCYTLFILSTTCCFIAPWSL